MLAPSPVLMPSGIYLQPGHPSYYQMGAPPTLLHPQTFQIHPTFLQQHAPPVLVQSSGQPTIIQQQMPRFVYLDPSGAVVSQVYFVFTFYVLLCSSVFFCITRLRNNYKATSPTIRVLYGTR